MRSLLRLNFVASVWLCVAIGALQFAANAAQLNQIRLQFGPFAGKAVLAPLGLAFAEVVFWFRMYRLGGPPARLGAACFSIGLVLVLIVQFLRDSIEIDVSPAGTLLYAYFAASHLVYATFDGWFERRTAEPGR